MPRSARSRFSRSALWRSTTRSSWPSGRGLQHTRARLDSVPAIVRPLVGGLVRRQIKKILWSQGLLRHAHEDIIESALRDWRAVLTVMSEGPFFFGTQPTGLDAIVFGALAT